jgi:hypothetical protein
VHQVGHYPESHQDARSTKHKIQGSLYCPSRDTGRKKDTRFYDLTRKHFVQRGFEFAEVNALRHRFNKEKKLAGKDWVPDFSTIHQLALRSAEQYSIVFSRMVLP